jgi:hypothetical protein
MQQSQSIANRRAERDDTTESGPLGRQLLCDINESFAGKHGTVVLLSSSAAITTSSTSAPASIAIVRVVVKLSTARAAGLGSVLAPVHPDLDIYAANYGGQKPLRMSDAAGNVP